MTFGNPTPSDWQNYRSAFQGPTQQEETLFNSPSIANRNSSVIQSNYNSPQNVLPTNNYTGCYQGLYYTNGSYTSPC